VTNPNLRICHRCKRNRATAVWEVNEGYAVLCASCGFDVAKSILLQFNVKDVPPPPLELPSIDANYDEAWKKAFYIVTHLSEPRNEIHPTILRGPSDAHIQS